MRVAGALMAVLLIAPTAAAQTDGGGADLAVAVAMPSQVAAGDAFSLTLSATNQGNEAVTDPVLSLYLPAEVSAEIVPDGCSTDVGGFAEPVGAPPPKEEPVSPDSPDGGGSAPDMGGAPGYYGGSLICQPPSLGPNETSAFEIGMRRSSARAIYLSAYAWSSAPEVDYEDNYTESFLEADTSRPADIGVALSGPSSPEVGGSFTYALTVTNAGPSTGEGITVVNPLPYGAEVTAATPARDVDVCTTMDYAIVCELAALDAGASTAISLQATRTSAWDVYDYAWVTSYNHDENYENDYAWHQIAPDPSVVSDLSLKLDVPATTPLAGEIFETTLTVRNDGPSGAGDVWANLWLPPELRFVSAAPSETCTAQPAYPYGVPEPAPSAGSPEGDAYYPSPGGLWCSFGALSNGATSSVTLLLERTGAREAWISGWVSTSNADPNYDNNYFDRRLDPDKSHPADVTLSMSGPDNPPVGENFTVTAEVANLGPDVAANVMLVDQLPWGAEFVSASDDSCTYETYFYPPTDGVEQPVWEGLPQLECALGDLDAGASRKIDITMHRTSEYELWNSGWVTTSSYDENWENDYAWMSLGGKGYEGDCTAAGEAEGSDGSDGIVVGDCDVSAGAGADSIAVSPSSAEEDSTVRGGSGPDTIQLDVRVGASSPRRVALLGGAGDDTIDVNVAPGTGTVAIVVDGGAGRDTIRLTIPAGLSGVTVLVRGRGAADRIEWIGSSGPYGKGMTVLAGDGRDVVVGGPADDSIRGGDGRDNLYGGVGRDELFGGRGSDVCRGGPERDTTSGC